MKKYAPTFLKLFLMCLLGFTVFFAGNLIVDNEDNSIPELLQRGEQIQLGKEWDYVQNSFSDLSKNIQNEIKADESKIKLAQLFIKEARVTGEHGHYYPAALQLLDEVLTEKDLDKDMKFIALMNKAGVQLSLHEFAAALETGNEAVLLNPSNAQIHGVLVDANVELGDYERAISIADRMISIKPDIRSYSRISYLREIFGDVDGSIEAMKLAAGAGYPGYEETAWAMLTLGDLLTEYGFVTEAEKVYNEILKTRENYPFAVGALANIYRLRGDMELAETTYKRAMNIIPEVGFYVSLAEMYKEQGRESEMNTLIDEIFVMLKEDVDSGHNMNLEYGHIYLDILEDVESAEKYISEEYNKRPANIDVNLMMARIAQIKGDYEEKDKFVAIANKTNSKNPELIKLMEG